MNKVKFTKEIVNFLKENGTIIQTADNNQYMFMPFWFKTTDDPEVLELHKLEGQLPADLVDAINDHRDINRPDNPGLKKVMHPLESYQTVKGTNPDGTPNGYTFSFIKDPFNQYGPDGGIL